MVKTSYSIGCRQQCFCKIQGSWALPVTVAATSNKGQKLIPDNFRHCAIPQSVRLLMMVCIEPLCIV